MSEVKVNCSFIEKICRRNLFNTKCNSFKVEKFSEPLLKPFKTELNLNWEFRNLKIIEKVMGNFVRFVSTMKIYSETEMIKFSSHVRFMAAKCTVTITGNKYVIYI